MKNERFFLLPEKERNAKFKAALNTKSGGDLTGDEIQEILQALPPDKQYEILVYHKPDDFCTGVARIEGARKRLILGTDFRGLRNQDGKLVCSIPSGAAAVMVRKKTAREEYSQLHIFVPPERCRKEQECL